MSADLFAATMGRLGVALPLKVDREFPGSIVDQNGTPVLQVDVNAEFVSDGEADQIAALIVVAVNSTAGIAAPEPEKAS
jgi:hypothetical protein